MRVHAPRLLAALVALCFVAPASAATVSTFYGDDDGFGIGKTGSTDTINAVNPNASSDAQFTDIRLIGTNCGGTPCAAPAFAPNGGFTPFVVDGVVVSALLTMRVGAFDSGPNPFDGPNVLKLDGMAVNPSFLSGFSSLDTNFVQTRSLALDPGFFALINDGAVSLSGTHISNDTGSGSFQVDMLRLQIVSEPSPPPATVPLPGSAALAMAGLLALGLMTQLNGMAARRPAHAQI
ncbi:MAG: hypothetical protein ACJAVR_000139 [Paracoccaceae bacterium]|jgi:hypothetical protein